MQTYFIKLRYKNLDGSVWQRDASARPSAIKVVTSAPRGLQAEILVGLGSQIAVIMLADHGDTDAKGRYWRQSAAAEPGRLPATAVSQNDLSAPLGDIGGKKILFLDTCHANAEKIGPEEPTDAMRGLGPAGVDVACLVNGFSRIENGLITFAAAQGTELAAKRAE
jgi:hypothetical protein